MNNGIPERRKTRGVRIGSAAIGAENPVAVQSMAKTLTTDIEATSEQIRRLEKCGCDIVRVAAASKKDTEAFAKIAAQANLPLVADIHFSAQRAIEAIEAGAAKIRINPGNMRSWKELDDVIACAKANSISIRIGINEASIRNLKEDTPSRDRVSLMFDEMSEYVREFEKRGFEELVLSAKSVNVNRTIAINRRFSESFAYPIHIGLTHSGLPEDGLVPSAAAMGSLLSEGIGDTIRISLAGEPENEVTAAQDILASFGLYEKNSPKIVVCPTCGRCMIDVLSLARKIKQAAQGIEKPLNIAVMGCIVNGPGEAADADLAVCAGSGKGYIYRGGRKLAVVQEENLLEEFSKQIKLLAAE
ncbi:flavodoxin-dependent (E)-4-hydroxy-3-methylbut-2-enyl-diphosphate synthase [Sedimentisphaera salicampi]|uniref:flavodoxin-dependent (E)-4-hydroxy-3-methylbut-2-enyl-diphosphate synthase n=1 Tax=Sedimentisphaera salicampi TaxID=1941349 RepID=UPI000B9B177E|nr:flavodoxin-dependent (E)-4-hydroxy-3-methylbut-2-enyl-diphosphate synthase [Sedimentisphaera salicampi]OXU15353.1 4-hydroxy-3-methylbut-2-en-1-yl diphosphate synthase [Sedimentisphaera salicampi]